MAQSNSKPPMSYNFGLEGSQSKPLAYGKSGFPPFSPLPLSESSLASNSSAKDVSMEEVDVSSRGPSIGGSSYILENAFRGSFEGLPPRNGHRRSNSDVPLGFNAFIRTSHQLVPIISQGGIRSASHCIDNRRTNESVHMEKQENDTFGDHEIPFCGLDEKKYEEKVRNDLYGSYVTRDYVSGGFKDGFDSCSNKRAAAGDIPSATRHFRSLSVDSAFGSLSSGDQSPILPSLLETQRGPLSSSHIENGDSARFSLEFGNGEFSESELKKIRTEERLAEIAFLDPKRAKRILANRQSAARSKERKVRYTAELEHKVQTLQTEASTLSTQIRILQKDFTEIKNHNNELKFRLKAMEQQARLRDALHEALTAEMRHLKLAITGNGEGGGASSCMIQQQMPMKNHIQQLEYHQSNHLQQMSAGTPKSSTANTSA